MQQLFMQAFWFWLPNLVGNQCGGWARHLHLPGGTKPLWERGLGANKTLAPYYLAPLVGVAAVYLQRYFFPDICHRFGLFDYDNAFMCWFVGATDGVGAVVGDHVKSFLKRRLPNGGTGIAPGQPWWPWDYIDYTFGGIIFRYVFIGYWVGWSRTILIVIMGLIIHPIGNGLGYLIGQHKTWR